MFSAARGSILVIEDDDATREMFKLALKGARFHVLEATDGVEALRMIDSSPPSLIILDLGLPRLSGLDVAREIATRPDTRTVPLLVVTGQDPVGLPASLTTCILRKPIDPELLVATTEKCLRDRARR